MRARLFVALWPPPRVVTEVERVLAPLAGSYGHLRWQSSERWHITVGFLGDRDVDKEIERFGRISPAPAESIALAGSGRFGPVLWLGVTRSDWLAGLAGDVRHTMHCVDRRFRGHVTVARSRSRDADRELSSAVSALASFRSDHWTPGEITLVRSTTGPRPSYEVVASCPLTPAGS